MTADGLGTLLDVLGRDPDERLSINYLNGHFTSQVTTVSSAATIATWNGGHDCWYGTAVLHERVSTGRGTAADVTGIRELFADLDAKPDGVKDYATADAVIADLADMVGTVPSAVVDSGHGLQPHWPLERGDGTDWTDETSPEWGAAAVLLRRWGRLVAMVAERHGGHVDNVYDLPRVLRVPGTRKNKNPAKPIEVVADYPGGSPVTLARLRDVLDEYAVPTYQEDSEPLGATVSAPGTWTHGERSCGYVTAMVTGWAQDQPKARHPWLVGQATRLAAAHRAGCLTADDHRTASTHLADAFRRMLATGETREESPGEVRNALAWGVARVATKNDAHVSAELGEHRHTEQVTVLEDSDRQPAEAFWGSRPELAHVRDFARARLCSPLATLAVVLARVVTAVPHHFVLPPIIGGDASLNLFAAVVAPSGHGKGAAEAAARDAVVIDGITQYSLGSGEGIARTYGHRERVPDDNGRKGGSVIVRDHWALLFSVAEVDTLTALGARQGATLLPQVRSAYMGEPLGFAYSDPQKAITIPVHEYRLCLVLGVQPGRAAGLLDDADGGTPQRFLWVPATDPAGPTEIPTAPDPMRWTLPTRPAGAATTATGRIHLDVPQVARDAVVTAAQARNRGEIEALDGHALLTRLKVAAALGLFAGRVGIDEDDWQLAGDLMDVSDRTRAGVVRYLSTRAEDANAARGRAEGQRAVVVSETVEAAEVRKAGQSIVKHLREHGDTTWADERKRLNSRLRAHFDDAVDALASAGVVTVETAGRGQLLRLSVAAS